MADDGDAFESEQRRSAVLRVIETLLEICERVARKQEAELARDSGLQRFLENGADGLDETFADLERDVANKAVTDDDIGASVVEVAAFDVAEKIDRQSFDELEGITGKVIAFGLFLTDGQKTDARIGGGGKASAEDGAEINFSHDGELLEVVGLAIDVGANIKHDGCGVGGGGEDGGQGGAVHSGQNAEDELCGDHCGAGVSGGDEARGGAVFYETETDTHGGVTLMLDGLRGFFIHADEL